MPGLKMGSSFPKNHSYCQNTKAKAACKLTGKVRMASENGQTDKGADDTRQRIKPLEGPKGAALLVGVDGLADEGAGAGVDEATADR